jgi:hypothetical protein
VTSDVQADTIALTAALLLPELKARAEPARDPATVAVRDLVRYYRLLAQELESVHLSEREALLCWHGCTMARQAKAEGRAPFPSLEAAVLAEWRRLGWESGPQHVDGRGLAERIGRLERLEPARLLALLDALERFHALVLRDGWSHDIAGMLRAVGLLREEPEPDRG